MIVIADDDSIVIVIHRFENNPISKMDLDSDLMLYILNNWVNAIIVKILLRVCSIPEGKKIAVSTY